MFHNHVIFDVLEGLFVFGRYKVHCSRPISVLPNCVAICGFVSYKTVQLLLFRLKKKSTRLYRQQSLSYLRISGGGSGSSNARRCFLDAFDHCFLHRSGRRLHCPCIALCQRPQLTDCRLMVPVTQCHAVAI